MAHLLKILRVIFAWRNYLITIAVPLLLLPLFKYDNTEYEKEARCCYVLLMMVVFWTTECIPIAVSALIPMVLYPMFEIVKAKELAPKYMSEVNMAFIGSYIMVIAFENAQLHKRFALKILLTVGPQPRWLLFGIMLSACILSMFTNNTMSCALHLPIVKGIIDELREVGMKRNKTGVTLATNAQSPPPGIVITECEHQEKKLDTAPGNKEICGDSAVHSVHSDTEVDFERIGRDLVKMSNESIELNPLQPTGFGVMEINPSDTVVEPSLSLTHRMVTVDHEDEGNVSPLAGNSVEDVEKRDDLSEESLEDDVMCTKTIDGIEKMLLIASAYSASIGGMTSLIGTPTNLVMKERSDIAFEAYNCTSPVTFTSWLFFGAPVGYTFIVIAWFWLQIFFLGPKYVFHVWIRDPFRRYFRKNRHHATLSAAKVRAAKQAERITSVMKQLYAELDPMGFQQFAVMFHCILLVVLLVTRRIGTGEGENYVGWGIVAPAYVKESTATVVVALLMFIIPSRLPSWRMSEAMDPPPPLLRWRQVDGKFPFGVILLVGGGMAAASGAQASGLPALIAPVIGNLLEGVSMKLSVLFTSVLIAGMTEFMSNVACVTLIAPIMERLARELSVNPLLFLFPTTLSASFAFMLPVATPPNALVFSTNRLRIVDMVMCGFTMNMIGTVVIFVATNTWGNWYFSLYELPCAS